MRAESPRAKLSSGKCDHTKKKKEELWHRLLRRPVSEYGRLRRGDGNPGRGNRGRRAVHVVFALLRGTSRRCPLLVISSRMTPRALSTRSQVRPSASA